MQKHQLLLQLCLLIPTVGCYLFVARPGVVHASGERVHWCDEAARVPVPPIVTLRSERLLETHTGTACCNVPAVVSR